MYRVGDWTYLHGRREIRKTTFMRLGFKLQLYIVTRMTCDYSKEEKMKEEDRVGSCQKRKKEKTKSRFIFLLAFVMHAIKNNYFFDIQHN